MSDDLVVAEADLPLIWPKEGLRPHQFATIFRMLQGDEKVAFDADVAANGLREKIVVYTNAILDGRNRYLAVVDAGDFDPATEDWRERADLFESFEGTHDQAFAFVWSLNDQRRHDTPSQRAFSAERYANLRGETKAEAAEKFGVSKRQVVSAAAVREHGEPELQQAVEDGRVPLYLAEQLADLPAEDQLEVAAAPKREASAKARAKLKPADAPLVRALPMQKFAQFTQSVLNLSRGGQGSSVDAGTIVSFAQHTGIVAAEGEGWVFTPEALASLGTLAAAERQQPKVAEVRNPFPAVPPVGQSAVFDLAARGGVHKGDKASFEVFHEGNGTFSISSEARIGAWGMLHPASSVGFSTFALALAAAAQELRQWFYSVADRPEALASDAERASARDGAKWIEQRLFDWGLTVRESVSPEVHESNVALADAIGGALESFETGQSGEEAGASSPAPALEDADTVIREVYGRGGAVDFAEIERRTGKDKVRARKRAYQLGLSSRDRQRDAVRLANAARAHHEGEPS